MSIKFTTSSIKSTSYSLYTLSDFNGVDYTTTPTKVDSSRAIDISNYLPEGNSLVKRYGISRVSDLTFTYNNNTVEIDELLDCFSFLGEQFYVLSSNNKIYIRSNNTTTITQLTNTTGSNKALHFIYDDRLFVLVGGNYIMIYKSNNQYVIESVLSNAYVPTVITNLNPNNLDNKPLMFEQVNLLTNKVKISLNIYISNGSLVGNFYDLTDYFDLSSGFSVESISYNGST